MNPIHADCATKYYGSIKAVDCVSLSLGKGEIGVLLGPNGAGKTTLLRAIGGSLRLDKGHAYVLGINANERPLLVRRLVGLTPETNISFPELTVEENIMFASHLFGVDPRSEWISSLVERLGLKDYLGRKAGSLSKGYRRRVDIVMSLVHNPEVVIMDEPASGLDPVSSIEFRGFLKELRDSGRSVLVATHNIGFAMSIGDRVFLLSNGKLIVSAPIDKARAMLGWKEISLIVTITPAQNTDKFVRAVTARGVRAGKRSEGIVVVVGPAWDSLRAIVDAGLETDTRVERLSEIEMSWEEAFARFLSREEVKSRGRECPCKCA